jgi:hypothetical protein
MLNFKKLFTTWVYIFLLLELYSCNKTHTNRTGPIDVVLQEAVRQKDTLQNSQAADSLLNKALEKAIVLNDPKTNTQCYISILEHSDPENISDEKGYDLYSQAKENAEKSNSTNLKKQVYYAYSNFLINKNQPYKALNYLNLTLNSSEENPKYKIIQLIILSKIEEKQNLPEEQLRNLLDAHYLAYDLGHDSLKVVTLGLLSDYYYFQKKYEKALEYNMKVKTEISQSQPIDSTKWYYAEENRVLILTQFLNNEAIAAMTKKIVRYAKKHNLKQLSYNAQSSLRTYYFNQLEFGKLKQWYKENPEDLKALESDRPTIYHRIKAGIAEHDREKDSAIFYWNLAKEEDNLNPHFQYNYYLRKAEFEKRMGLENEKIKDLEKAFQYCLQTNIYSNQVELGEQIAQHYLDHQQSDKAFQILEKLNSAKSQWIKVLSNENIQNIELNNILAQKELEHQKSQDALERKHFTQYLIIILFIILVAMAMVVISFYKIPDWWIKSMGYISFIMFFEFIILLVDHQLHEITHGAPIPILLSKIVLLSFLFPTHHWLEKKFIQLLLNGHIRKYIISIIQNLKSKKTKNIHLDE